jgi:hypothetical protein
MKSVFEKFLDNLVIAALVPSLVFFTILVFLFGDLVPANIVEKLHLIFGTRAVMIFTMASCTSFVLAYLSETIYWFYRGEFVTKKINYPEKLRAQKLQGEIDALTQKIDELIQIDNTNPVLIEAIEKKIELVGRYQYTFPPMAGILPFRFGNILAAAEYYPVHQYGMKSGQMWVRLKQVIPAESMGKIDQINHEMAFLVNSSLFSILLIVFSFFGALYQFVLFTTAFIREFLSFFSISSGALELFISGLIYVGLCFIFSGLAWFFYRLSLPIAQRYAEIYRCAFDLFRFQLSEQLHFGCPKSTDVECQHWMIIDEFLNTEPGAVPVAFPYTHPKVTKDHKTADAIETL